MGDGETPAVIRITLVRTRSKTWIRLRVTLHHGARFVRKLTRHGNRLGRSVEACGLEDEEVTVRIG
jgi:hypothetical protein